MKKRYGFTLIELLIAISIMAILVALAIPSYLDFFEKGRLRGATVAVYEQLQYARAQALKRSVPMIVDFWVDPDAPNWALGITDDSECWALADPSTCATWGCNASDTTSCAVDFDNDPTTNPLPVRMASTDYQNVTMSAPVFDSTSGLGVCDTTVTAPTIPASALPDTKNCIEPIRGLSRKTKITAPAGHIELSNGDYKLQVRVNDVGGVTICRPTGSKYFVGYNECP